MCKRIFVAKAKSTKEKVVIQNSLAECPKLWSLQMPPWLQNTSNLKKGKSPSPAGLIYVCLLGHPNHKMCMEKYSFYPLYINGCPEEMCDQVSFSVPVLLYKSPPCSNLALLLDTARQVLTVCQWPLKGVVPMHYLEKLCLIQAFELYLRARQLKTRQCSTQL